ncbi:MAG TPA: S1/P1 Nuclease [Caulobacteraceae bacterium]|nr:S1/P1 Nuclease [Caulobacteraceae bacterium]
MSTTCVRLGPALAALAIGLCAATSAGAWGSTGHRMIGRLAIEALPDEIPAFLRTPAAVEAIGELSREPDRSKDAGKAHDSDLDPAHFLDLGDDGRVFGGPALAALPQTRAEYEAALRAVGQDSWRAGYLPYSIIEGWQQLAKDFGYWRVDDYGARTTTDPARRAWYEADRAEREALVERDLGALSHFAGDASQPLHVSVHYNGWGPFPNPEGFTTDRVHGPFEGRFVRQFVGEADVRAHMAPFHDCGCPIERRVADFIATTDAEVVPFYRLWKAGGFGDGDARGRAFAAERLAAGADEVRDLAVLAWRAGADGIVGYPGVKVADVLAGRADPYDSLLGVD